MLYAKNSIYTINGKNLRVCPPMRSSKVIMNGGFCRAEINVNFLENQFLGSWGFLDLPVAAEYEAMNTANMTH